MGQKSRINERYIKLVRERQRLRDIIIPYKVERPTDGVTYDRRPEVIDCKIDLYLVDKEISRLNGLLKG